MSTTKEKGILNIVNLIDIIDSNGNINLKFLSRMKQYSKEEYMFIAFIQDFDYNVIFDYEEQLSRMVNNYMDKCFPICSNQLEIKLNIIDKEYIATYQSLSKLIVNTIYTQKYKKIGIINFDDYVNNSLVSLRKSPEKSLTETIRNMYYVDNPLFELIQQKMEEFILKSNKYKRL